MKLRESLMTMAKLKSQFPNFKAVEVVALPQFEEPGRGALGVAECGVSVPFAIARAFYLYDLPADAVRGEHAHRETHQFVICLAGAIEASLWDRDGKRSIVLEHPATGLYVRPMTWLGLVNRSPATVCLVLASDVYDGGDYIRDAQEFAKLISVD
jgi:hypothetical protein